MPFSPGVCHPPPCLTPTKWGGGRSPSLASSVDTPQFGSWRSGLQRQQQQEGTLPKPRRSGSADSYFRRQEASAVVEEERDRSIAFGMQLLVKLRTERRKATREVAGLRQKAVYESERADEAFREKDKAIERLGDFVTKYNKATTQNVYLVEEAEAAATAVASLEAQLEDLRKLAAVSGQQQHDAFPSARAAGPRPSSPKRFTFYDGVEFPQPATASIAVQATPNRRTKGVQAVCSTDYPDTLPLCCRCRQDELGDDDDVFALRTENEMLRAKLNRQEATMRRLERRCGGVSTPSFAASSASSPSPSWKLDSVPFQRFSPRGILISGPAPPPPLSLSLAEEMKMLQDQDHVLDEEVSARGELENQHDALFGDLSLSFRHGSSLLLLQSDEARCRSLLLSTESQVFEVIFSSARVLQRKQREDLIFMGGLLDATISEESQQRQFISDIEAEFRVVLARSGERYSSSMNRVFQNLARRSIESQHRKCRMEVQRLKEAVSHVERSHGCIRNSIEMREENEREQLREVHLEEKRAKMHEPPRGKKTAVATDPEFLSRMVKAARKQHQQQQQQLLHQQMQQQKKRSCSTPGGGVEVYGRWVESPSKALKKGIEIRCDSTSPPPQLHAKRRATRSTSLGRESSIGSVLSKASSRIGLSPLPNGFVTPARSRKQSLSRAPSVTPRASSQAPIAHWAYDFEYSNEWKQLRESVLHATRAMGVKIAQIHDSKDKEGIFKVSHQALKAVVSEALRDRHVPPGHSWDLQPEEIERLPRHARNNVLKALRDLVCAYDMMRDTQKGSLLTVREVQNNVSSLLLLARWSQQSQYTSHSRSSSINRPTTPTSAGRSRSYSPCLSIGRHSTFLA